MSAFQAYLKNSKTRKVLSKKPGEAGFSLIELVVVVAVLAVLVAVALPNFTLITHKAKVNQGKNALVTAIKECKVTEADSGTAKNTPFAVEGFTVDPAKNTCAAGFEISPKDGTQYATFKVSSAGTKSCTVPATKSDTNVLGCTPPSAAEITANDTLVNASALSADEKAAAKTLFGATRWSQ